MPKSNKTKIILFTGYHDHAIFYSVVSPPIGLYRLKHYVEKRGMECEVYDLGLSQGNFGDKLDKISQGFYDVVGVSVDTDKMGKNFSMLLDMRKRIEQSGKKVMLVCGGQGASHDYKSWINEGKLDAVLLGFAEKNFYDLCLSFEKNKDKKIKEYAKDVCGVAFPTNEERTKFVKYPTKPLTEKEFEQLNYHEIKDLFIPYNKYWDYTYKEGASALNLKKEGDAHGDMVDTQKFFVETIRLYTSSHCPWKCGFCSSHSFLRTSNASMELENKKIEKKEGQNVSMNSLVTCGPQPHPVYRIYPKQIFDLIQIHCDKYDPKVFLFNDDAFWDGSTQGFKHIMDLCDLIIDAKKKGRIKKNVIFNCQAKVGDFIIKKPARKLHDDLIIKLKEAGFYHFGTGVETFSDKLLKVQSINKKISEADQHMVINGLLKHGFSPSVNLILFIPESTVEDMYSTMKTATEYMLKGVQIAMTPLLRPNPGSGIHELITKGLTPIKAKWVEWKNPDTGKIFKHPLYCIPLDKKIAQFIEDFEIKEFEDMERISGPEQERIVKLVKWKSKVVPRPVTALSVFITLSRFLERYDWVEYFEKAVFEILGRNSSLTNKNDSLQAKESLIL